MSAAPQMREELAKVSSLVFTARKLLATGTLVDLSAIEERVRGVAEAVAEMPQEDGRTLLDDLLALMRRLDGLGEYLQEQLNQVNGTLDDGGA